MCHLSSLVTKRLSLCVRVCVKRNRKLVRLFLSATLFFFIHVAQFRGIIGRTSVVSHYRPRKGNYKNRPSGTTGPGRTIATSSTIVMGAPKSSSSSSSRKCVSEEKDFRTSTSAANLRSIIWGAGPGRAVGCERENPQRLC